MKKDNTWCMRNVWRNTLRYSALQNCLLFIFLGALTALAFPPFKLWPLALLAPAVLLRLTHNHTPRQAAYRGFCFGIGFFAVGVYWISISIYRYGGAPLILACGLTGVLVAYMALYPALVSYILQRWFSRHSWLRACTVFPALWVMSEWLRGVLFTGFPWLFLGYSQMPSPLSSLAPWFSGVYGVGLISCIIAGALSLLVSATTRKSALITLACTALLTGLAWLSPTTPQQGEALRISLVQGNIAQQLKWEPEQLATIRQHYLKLSEPLWQQSDLILWPEIAIPDFAHHQIPLLTELTQQARTHHVDVLIGIPILEQQTDQYYNSILQLGEHSAIYHKQRLVPFGEYVPLESWLRGLIAFFDLPMSAFSRGPENQANFKVRHTELSPAICYEIAYPELIRDNLKDAGILVAFSNDAWFGDSFGPAQHLQIAQMRALETGRPLLRVTNDGITAVVSAKGAILAQAPRFQSHVLQTTLAPHSGKTLFVRFGLLPLWLVCMLGLGWAYWRNKVH